MELAAVAGIVLDPWQEFFLDICLREDENNRWAAPEVGLVVARQNGKGTLLVALEIAGLFLLGEKTIMHSAQLFSTAGDAFRRLMTAIESSPDLDAQVKRVSRTNGKEGVELKSGARCLFFARTVNSGRGFTVDRLVLDECYSLTDAQMSAMVPTMGAVDNPQVIYTSSAVNQEEHDNGLVLARVRARGIRGDTGLAYLEWSAEDDADHRDPLAWAQANPALGVLRQDGTYGMRPEALARDQRIMSSKSFAVEKLSIGDWPAEDGSDRVISEVEWATQAAPGVKPKSRVVFAVHVNRESVSSSISVAGEQADGTMLVGLVEIAPGVEWVVPELLRLKAKHNPIGMVIDLRSETAALLKDMKAAGMDPITPAQQDIPRGCVEFRNSILDHSLFHTDEPPLNASLASAKKRDLMGSWAWDRKDYMSDLTPIISATLAVWGYRELKSRVVDVSASFW